MKRRSELKVWIEGTVIAAMAMALSLIPTTIGSSFSISLGMIPITLFALRRGVKAGFYSAFIWGLMHFPLSQVYYLTPVQVVIEYVLAFGFAGFSGLYTQKLKEAIIKNEKRKTIRIIFYASFLGTVVRYFWHFVAGVIFWGSFAIWGLSPLVFSFVMNGVTAIATACITAIVLSIIVVVNPALFVPERKVKW